MEIKKNTEFPHLGLSTERVQCHFGHFMELGLCLQIIAICVQNSTLALSTILSIIIRHRLLL